MAEIVRLLRIPDGSAQIIVQGISRVRITNYLPEQRFFRVNYEVVPDEIGNPVEREALLRNVRGLFEKYVDNGGSILPELAMTAKNTEDPAHFADLVASSPDLTLEQREQLLEMPAVVERLKFISVFLAKQNEILELKAKIQSEVQQTLDKTQREYFLREQMKAIQKELGDDDAGSELRELRESGEIEQAGRPECEEKALKEVVVSKDPACLTRDRVIRTYVDWLAHFRGARQRATTGIRRPAKSLARTTRPAQDQGRSSSTWRRSSPGLRAPILRSWPARVADDSRHHRASDGRKFIRRSPAAPR